MRDGIAASHLCGIRAADRSEEKKRPPALLAASTSRKILCVRSLLVVLERESELLNCLVDRSDGIGAVSAKVVGCFLQLDASRLQLADGRANTGVRFHLGTDDGCRRSCLGVGA